MNLVVHPEGTAELDDRPVSEVVRDVFDHERLVTININAGGEISVTKVLLDPNAGELSHVAAQVMLHLTGQHYTMPGVTVFAELDPTLAHELLELARD